MSSNGDATDHGYGVGVMSQPPVGPDYGDAALVTETKRTSTDVPMTTEAAKVAALMGDFYYRNLPLSAVTVESSLVIGNEKKTNKSRTFESRLAEAEAKAAGKPILRGGVSGQPISGFPPPPDGCGYKPEGGGDSSDYHNVRCSAQSTLAFTYRTPLLPVWHDSLGTGDWNGKADQMFPKKVDACAVNIFLVRGHDHVASLMGPARFAEYGPEAIAFLKWHQEQFVPHLIKTSGENAANPFLYKIAAKLKEAYVAEHKEVANNAAAAVGEAGDNVTTEEMRRLRKAQADAKSELAKAEKYEPPQSAVIERFEQYVLNGNKFGGIPTIQYNRKLFRRLTKEEKAKLKEDRDNGIETKIEFPVPDELGICKLAWKRTDIAEVEKREPLVLDAPVVWELKNLAMPLSPKSWFTLALPRGSLVAFTVEVGLTCDLAKGTWRPNEKITEIFHHSPPDTSGVRFGQPRITHPFGSKGLNLTFEGAKSTLMIEHVQEAKGAVAPPKPLLALPAPGAESAAAGSRGAKRPATEAAPQPAAKVTRKAAPPPSKTKSKAKGSDDDDDDE